MINFTVGATCKSSLTLSYDLTFTIASMISHAALIIWTDGDREGENIGFEIISVCRAIKPTIAVHRAKFSEITQNAIRRACNNLVPPDEV